MEVVREGCARGEVGIVVFHVTNEVDRLLP